MFKNSEVFSRVGRKERTPTERMDAYLGKTLAVKLPIFISFTMEGSGAKKGQGKERGWEVWFDPMKIQYLTPNS